MDHIDPQERPPEVVSELAGAELALPYLLESPEVAAFVRLAADSVARARVSEQPARFDRPAASLVDCWGCAGCVLGCACVVGGRPTGI